MQASCVVLYSPRNSSGRLTRDSSPGISHSDAAGGGVDGDGSSSPGTPPSRRGGDEEGRDLGGAFIGQSVNVFESFG